MLHREVLRANNTLTSLELSKCAFLCGTSLADALRVNFNLTTLKLQPGYRDVCERILADCRPFLKKNGKPKLVLQPRWRVLEAWASPPFAALSLVFPTGDVVQVLS